MHADMNLPPVRRSLLPENLGEWFRSRGRVYLVVLGCVVTSFFFVAGWMATPVEHASLGGIGIWQAVVAFGALVLAWVIARWASDRQKGRGGATGSRNH